MDLELDALARSVARHQKVAELSAGGKTVRQIADLLGARYLTVYQFLRRHEIKVKPSAPETGRQKKLTRAQIEKIVAAAAAGATLSSLSKRFGVALGTVQWHVRRAKREYPPRRSASLVTHLAAEFLE